MESTGKVIQILPAQEGTKRDGSGTWKSQSFIIETLDQYPRKQCFEIFGEDRINSNLPATDAQVRVSFDLESREWQGRWFTSARAYKVEPAVDAKPMAAQPMPAAAPTQNPAVEQLKQTLDAQTEGTELPF